MSSIPPLPEDVRRLVACDVAHTGTPDAERTQVLRELEVTLGLALAPSVALLAKAPVSSIVAPKLGLGLAAKVSLVVALGGSAIAGVWLLRPTSHAALAPAPQSSARPDASAPVTAAPSSAVAIEAETPPSPSANAPLKSASRPASTSTDNLAEERRLLAGARSALQQHNLGQATDLLAEHARRFGSGSMGQERDRLLVQAAVLSGDVGRARTQAQAFVKRYPKSVYTPGITRLLDTLK